MQARDHGALLRDRVRLLERRADRLALAQALDVPGMELAQVARCALGPEVLHGAVEHPAPLVEHLRRGSARRCACRAPGRTATGCRARRGRASPPRSRWTRTRRGRAPRPPSRPTRSPAPAARRPAAWPARSPACPCGARPRSAGGTSRPATPASSTSRRATSKPSTPPGLSDARSLTVTGRPEPSRAASATATAVSGSEISAAPAPVFMIFGTGQPMLRSIRSAPRAAATAAAERITSGSCPNSWIATGPPARSSGCTTSSSSSVLRFP